MVVILSFTGIPVGVAAKVVPYDCVVNVTAEMAIEGAGGGGVELCCAEQP